VLYDMRGHTNYMLMTGLVGFPAAEPLIFAMDTTDTRSYNHIPWAGKNCALFFTFSYKKRARQDLGIYILNSNITTTMIHTPAALN